MTMYAEIELKGKKAWSEEGYKIKVVEWDTENYKQKLEAKSGDKTETWYFGLQEQNSVVFFNGSLTVNDKGASFKNTVQTVSVETKK